MEQLTFRDRNAFEAFLAAIDSDPDAKATVDRYEAEFGVFNCEFTLLSEAP